MSEARWKEVMTTRANDASPMRELFVEELAEVKGGGPLEQLCEKLGGCYTTQACCEEGPDNCCSPG